MLIISHDPDVLRSVDQVYRLEGGVLLTHDEPLESRPAVLALRTR